MYEVGGLRKTTITVCGEQLHHYFADLKGDEWLEHQRALGELQGDGNNLRRVLAVYDARCKKVEGYTLEGADIMSLPLENWRDLIPCDHKVSAYMELVQGADLKKN